jgi:putative FmdB family regulatory protein
VPVYEYHCGKCDQEFEVEQRITDDPIKTCPKCRSRKVKRLISQTSFVLKGGGWYSDLYSSSKAKPDAAEKPASDKSAAEKPAGGASEPKGDTKSAARSDAGASGGKGSGDGKSKGKGTPKAAA